MREFLESGIVQCLVVPSQGVAHLSDLICPKCTELLPDREVKFEK